MGWVFWWREAFPWRTSSVCTQVIIFSNALLLSYYYMKTFIHSFIISYPPSLDPSASSLPTSQKMSQGHSSSDLPPLAPSAPIHPQNPPPFSTTIFPVSSPSHPNLASIKSEKSLHQILLCGVLVSELLQESSLHHDKSLMNTKGTYMVYLRES